MIYSHVRVDFQESNFGFVWFIMMLGLEYKGVQGLLKFPMVFAPTLSELTAVFG